MTKHDKTLLNRPRISWFTSVPPVALLCAAGILFATHGFAENRKQQAVEDWPNLGRFRAENAKLPPPAANENRIVFMGDSITDFWGRTVGKFFPGKPYINRGISGQTTPQMLIRFRYDVLDLKPRAVVILAGTNDLAGNTGPEPIEEIEGNLASMAELAESHDIRVILASLTPVCDLGKQMQTERRPPAKIVALNQWIRDFCARNGSLYLDYYSAMINDKAMLKSELTADGLHPNEAGYNVMAPQRRRPLRRP